MMILLVPNINEVNILFFEKLSSLFSTHGYKFKNVSNTVYHNLEYNRNVFLIKTIINNWEVEKYVRGTHCTLKTSLLLNLMIS